MIINYKQLIQIKTKRYIYWKNILKIKQILFGLKDIKENKNYEMEINDYIILKNIVKQ